MALAEQVFDCPPIWTLYRQNGQSFIRIFEDERFPGLERMLLLTPDMKEGSLYFSDTAAAGPGLFHGPTMELLMINYLAQGKGAVLHACGIVKRDSGMIFVGESGAGKSTLAGLWAQRSGVDILSDDRIIVRKMGDRYWMYGTPWHGEADYASPQGVALEDIFFLRQGVENAVEPVNAMSAVSRLVTCSFPPHWDAKGMNFTLGFFADAAANVPCHELTFVPDSSVIDFIRAFSDAQK
jgi:hypothetical protein